LIEQIKPVLVSGHLAWSTHEGDYLNDLLPLPYDEATLDLVSAHLDEIQNTLGCSYLVENPSSYVGLATSTMTEVEFMSELAERAGCRLLCDVSNIYLSARNMGFDPYEYVDRLPRCAIGQFHLGGFTEECDGADPERNVLIDTHATRIADPVWDLYAYAVRRLGPHPTIIEWDNDIPSFATLVAEAAKADRVISKQGAAARMHAVPCEDFQRNGRAVRQRIRRGR
jgi:uncharacterized protein (UPF0276 family)